MKWQFCSPEFHHIMMLKHWIAALDSANTATKARLFGACLAPALCLAPVWRFGAFGAIVWRVWRLWRQSQSFGAWPCLCWKCTVQILFGACLELALCLAPLRLLGTFGAVWRQASSPMGTQLFPVHRINSLKQSVGPRCLPDGPHCWHLGSSATCSIVLSRSSTAFQ
jgi:hypothetical protein